MAELKTKATTASVSNFLASVENKRRIADAKQVIKLMEKITGKKPVMWGPSIIGFGKYKYQYESGHKGEMCTIGFSPRKTKLVFYLMHCLTDKTDFFSRLGKYKLGVGCLYINKLADVNLDVLEDIIKESYEAINQKYECS